MEKRIRSRVDIDKFIVVNRQLFHAGKYSQFDIDEFVARQVDMGHVDKGGTASQVGRRPDGIMRQVELAKIRARSGQLVRELREGIVRQIQL